MKKFTENVKVFPSFPFRFMIQYNAFQELNLEKSS